MAIIALAWPTMLLELMQTAVQYIDTAMVGVLGTEATAAVGSTTTVGWLVGSSVSALGVGLLSVIARALGAGDKSFAKRVSGQSVLIVLVAGSLFTALTLSLSPLVPALMQVEDSIRSLAARYFFILYLSMLPRTATTIFSAVLRAAGDSKTPMKIGVLVNIINVILNFFFIYPTRTVEIFSLSLKIPGVGIGVEGAALASSVAFIIGGVLSTIALWRHKAISPKGQRILPDREILAPCLRVALPNMLQRFATSFGYVAFASMINSLGEISTAAHTIANTVESAFYIPGYGMQAAAATLSGNALGARDKKALLSLTRLLIIIEASLMVVTGGLLFIFAPQMMSLFTEDAQVLALGATVLRMVALSEPFYGVSIVTEGMLQGMGKTMLPFAVNTLGMWGIRILGTLVCTKVFSLGLVSAWSCMILHNLLLFALFTLIWVLELRKNWDNEKKIT